MLAVDAVFPFDERNRLLFDDAQKLISLANRWRGVEGHVHTKRWGEIRAAQLAVVEILSGVADTYDNAFRKRVVECEPPVDRADDGVMPVPVGHIDDRVFSVWLLAIRGGQANVQLVKTVRARARQNADLAICIYKRRDVGGFGSGW